MAVVTLRSDRWGPRPKLVEFAAMLVIVEDEQRPPVKPKNRSR
jgi:hypothetical protein